MTMPQLPPVRLRRGMGVALAIQWNLPFVLIVSHEFPIYWLLMIFNCFLWAGGIYLMGHASWWRNLFFCPVAAGTPPRWRAAAIWMLILAIGNLLAWYMKFGASVFAEL